MDELSHAQGHHHRAEVDDIFALQVAIAELVAVTEVQSLTLIARIELMETTTMSKLSTIEDKLDTLSTMLDAKAKADDADLDTIGAKVDDILAKHAPSAASTSAVVIDPTTGLPVTE